jgi:hypothetical protein
MKLIICLLLHFATLVVFAQQKTTSIYTFTKHFEGEDDTSDSTFFYLAKTNTKLLAFCKKLSWGDCNSMGYEWGKYEIKKDTIILYSLYAHQGGTNGQPFGVRKQMYIVKNKKVALFSNDIVLEEQYHSGNGSYIAGVEYIYKEPTNDTAKNDLELYVKTIEKAYGGKFILNNDGKKLIKEVRSRLKQIIAIRTKEWKKEAEPYNRFKI